MTTGITMNKNNHSNLSHWQQLCRSDALTCPTLLLILLLGGCVNICAQQATRARTTGSTQTNTAPAIVDVSKTTPPLAATAGAGDDRYRIGPGDVLDVRVFNRPQLSREAVRVDNRGMIRMPLIDGEIQAGCHTEGELAANIAERYLKYQRNPQVDVFVKEFQSQPVAMIGAVEKPGRFQLQRRVRLLELITFAGGPIERAGGRVQLIRSERGFRCNETTPDALANVDDQIGENVQVFNLGDTLRGDELSNPYVQPGDVISIPEAEQAYVVGNVVRPATIALKETITVSRAIAMAGGTLPDTKGDKVRILRQQPGGTTRAEIYVDLKAIDKRQAEDVALRAGDIVDVPTSGGKRFARGLLGAIAPAVSQLPVRVVP